MSAKRMFVAVWPTQPALEVLKRLDRPGEAPIRWSDPSSWHVTLLFLGNIERRMALESFESVDLSGLAVPVVARAGPSTSSFGGRVLYVPVGGLDELAQVVSAGYRAAGWQRPEDLHPAVDLSFSGHMTLGRARSKARSKAHARDRGPREAIAVEPSTSPRGTERTSGSAELASGGIGSFCGARVEVSWEVAEITLVVSATGSGVRYGIVSSRRIS